MSLSVSHSSRAESTETTWQLLPEDRYKLENNLAACTETKRCAVQFGSARPNWRRLDLIFETIVILAVLAAITVARDNDTECVELPRNRNGGCFVGCGCTMNIAWTCEGIFFLFIY